MDNVKNKTTGQITQSFVAREWINGDGHLTNNWVGITIENLVGVELENPTLYTIETYTTFVKQPLKKLVSMFGFKEDEE